MKGAHHPPGLGQGPGQGDRFTDGYFGSGGLASNRHNLTGVLDSQPTGRVVSSGSPGVFVGIQSEGIPLKGGVAKKSGGGADLVTEGSEQGVKVHHPRGEAKVVNPDVIPPPGTVTLSKPRIKRVRLKVRPS